MAFLIKSELKTVADVNLISKITALDDTIVSEIIDESISVMSGYLSKYYDVVTAFSKTGTERHKTILKRLKDIVIYEIYIRHTREMNKVAEVRYTEAMNWLEKMNTGEFRDSTIPAIPSDTPSEQSGMDIRYGSNPRYRSSF
jgi:phage gp36-like protein